MRKLGLVAAIWFGSGVSWATVPMTGLTRDSGEPLVSTRDLVSQKSPTRRLHTESNASSSLAVLAVAGAGVEVQASPSPRVEEAPAPVVATVATLETPAPVEVASPSPVEIAGPVPTAEPVGSSVSPSVGPQIVPTPGVSSSDGTGSDSVGGVDDGGSPSEEYQRLFGEGSVDNAGQPVQMDSGISLWFWPLVLIGVAGAWVWKRRGGKGAERRDEIQIVGRASLGREGSLAVIEVEDTDGRARRLLVGYGGGAPRLVADLADNDWSNSAPSPNAPEAGSRGMQRDASGWEQALESAEKDLAAVQSQEELIANVLADRLELRKTLGPLPATGSRMGVRQRAYRGTMA